MRQAEPVLSVLASWLNSVDAELATVKSNWGEQFWLLDAAAWLATFIASAIRDVVVHPLSLAAAAPVRPRQI